MAKDLTSSRIAAILLCMLGVSQTVSFGGFGMVDMLPESPFMAVLRGLWLGGAVPLAGAPLFV